MILGEYRVVELHVATLTGALRTRPSRHESLLSPASVLAEAPNGKQVLLVKRVATGKSPSNHMKITGCP